MDHKDLNDNEGQDAERESTSSTLADGLFSVGFLNSALEYNKKARQNLSRGAGEQAGEDLKRGFNALKGYFFNPTPSPYLTDSENDERKRLISRLYKVDEITGGIRLNMPFSDLRDRQEIRLRWLDDKASGIDPNS